jgi:hypothetical protein
MNHTTAPSAPITRSPNLAILLAMATQAVTDL